MEIKSKRILKGANSTLSRLRVNDKFFGYVLEDTDRGLIQGMPLAEIQRIKVPARTAIPTGRYRVDITWSNRFKRKMIILIGVPGFSGIRSHSGNTHQNTDGCLLTGFKSGTENGEFMVGDSRLASEALHKAVLAALTAGEEVWWTITQDYQ
ncbi:hypothetical protein SAMN04487996_12270 [Dyadobacter soli]|uniref:DUF5675 domain-containing protein n=1 Tax=Dyadobacter soli TaxID=659014 RepID=A0A1G7WJQ4_9BACT|nr:DUF5675 family protein [Dyadobacter soli]SDG72098.1 hypothetical protein SAMN04487996_12270 [Dyadobacter soli]